MSFGEISDPGLLEAQMFKRVIITLASVGLAGILFVRSDTDTEARGGGGFRGGGMSGFHSGGRFERPHRDEAHGERRDMRRDHSHHDGSHHDGSNHFGGRNAHGHTARFDDGHWHRSPGFGDNSNRSPNFDGQWHVDREFP